MSKLQMNGITEPVTPSTQEQTKSFAGEADNSNSSNEQLVEKVWEDEIFTILKDNRIKDEKKYCTVIGKYRLTEFDTLEENIRAIEDRDWKLILTTTALTLEQLNKDNNKNYTNEEEHISHQ